jgi:hypothetical protein
MSVAALAAAAAAAKKSGKKVPAAVRRMQEALLKQQAAEEESRAAAEERRIQVRRCSCSSPGPPVLLWRMPWIWRRRSIHAARQDTPVLDECRSIQLVPERGKEHSALHATGNRGW